MTGCLTVKHLTLKLICYKKRTTRSFNDNASFFVQLLEKCNSVIFHIRNLQYFAITRCEITLKYPQKQYKTCFL